MADSADMKSKHMNYDNISDANSIAFLLTFYGTGSINLSHISAYAFNITILRRHFNPTKIPPIY